MIIDRKIDIEMSLRQFMVQKWVEAHTHTHITLEREIKASNWFVLRPFLLGFWRRMLPMPLFIIECP